MSARAPGLVAGSRVSDDDVTGFGGTMLRLVLPLVLFASPALAHTGSASGGFAGGLAHPVLGPDHVIAMVAVGLWGAFLGAPAI
jgi:hydrogenase/urease accessory protein HupE